MDEFTNRGNNMPKYNVSLHTQQAYDYTVEADSREEAIEKAKDIHACQEASETMFHLYDFNWLECDAYIDKPDDVPEYKSNPLFGRK
jgi:hypothetical protein